MRERNNMHSPGHSGNFTVTIWRQFIRPPAKSCPLFSSILLLLLVGALVSTRLLDYTAFRGNINQKLRDGKSQTYATGFTEMGRNKTEYPLICTAGKDTKTCPGTYQTSYTPEEDHDSPPAPMCPDYFRWIHEDLRPWAHTGITREMVERASEKANFRLVVIKGRAYVVRYKKSFQSRDTFTLWGILQLLRMYPGKIPDLDLPFDCSDRPVVLKSEHCVPGDPAPPPLFRYCGHEKTLDIVFPDWSFWGWPEINMKSWEPMMKDLEEEHRKMKWIDREPYAFWKGNIHVALLRKDLMKCNVSEGQEWNARLFKQNWQKERRDGFKESDLARQCKNRFKIYIEGSSWSVSEKFILACDSVALFVTPNYTDFFTRGLMPMQHYWPININNKCKSIKFAVDWGNNHTEKAQEIGKAANKFVQEDLKLDYVYDYMFHLLNQYSKLFRYQPTIPPGAVEYCAESMVCPEEGLARTLMEESLVRSPRETSPCTLPPPYDSSSLYDVLLKKEKSIQQVESWVNAYR